MNVNVFIPITTNMSDNNLCTNEHYFAGNLNYSSKSRYTEGVYVRCTYTICIYHILIQVQVFLARGFGTFCEVGPSLGCGGRRGRHRRDTNKAV